MSTAFSRCHPAVNLLFFVEVFVFSAVLRHPAFQTVSLMGALLWAHSLRARGLWRLLPLALLTSAINPLFNHAGVTILGYFPSGNPLTLESLLYGLSSGVMLVTVIVWCIGWNAIMTADKLVYLSGRAAPSLSLLLTISLRFVPRFQTQLRRISQARRGLYGPPHTLRQRMQSAVATLTALLSWALENGIATADSMHARGCGLPGRTAYAPYHLTGYDRGILLLLLALGGGVLAAALCGFFDWNYLPSISGTPACFGSLIALAAYAALCLLPVLLERKEAKAWRGLHLSR